MEKILILSRHAKYNLKSRERELLPDGWKQSQIVGTLLVRKGLSAAFGLHSELTRTIETAEAMGIPHCKYEEVLDKTLGVQRPDTTLRIEDAVKQTCPDMDILQIVCHSDWLADTIEKISRAEKEVPYAATFILATGVSNWPDFSFDRCTLKDKIIPPQRSAYIQDKYEELGIKMR